MASPGLSSRGLASADLAVKLAMLERFPAAVVAAGHDGLAHYTLEDFERLYVEVGPVNYGWYQCQLHVGAKQVFDQGGEDVIHRYWALLPQIKRGVTTNSPLPSRGCTPS